MNQFPIRAPSPGGCVSGWNGTGRELTPELPGIVPKQRSSYVAYGKWDYAVRLRVLASFGQSHGLFKAKGEITEWEMLNTQLDTSHVITSKYEVPTQCLSKLDSGGHTQRNSIVNTETLVWNSFEKCVRTDVLKLFVTHPTSHTGCTDLCWHNDITSLTWPRNYAAWVKDRKSENRYHEPLRIS